MAVTAISWAITLVGGLGFSSMQKRKAERSQRAAYDASVVDRLVNTQTTVGPRELVMGRTRKGGNVFFQSAVAPYNSTFVTTIALAAHEIDGVERIFFNDTPIDLDGAGNVTTAPWGKTTIESVMQTSISAVTLLDRTPIAASVQVVEWISQGNGEDAQHQRSPVPFSLNGNVVTLTNPPVQGATYYISYQWSNFLSVARVYVHLGSPGQPADARLQAFLPGTWTAAHRAAGVAYLQCEFVYEESAFPNGLPNVTALIRGARMYDPRTNTFGWSENPALMMRNVLTHPQFGKRTSLTDAEEARISAAANACDLLWNYTGAEYVPMFRAALVAQFGAPARDVLDDLAQAMGGEWAFAAGEFFVRAGVYQAPVMNLTDADLAVVQRNNESVSQSSITLSPHKPRNEKINIVSARIWDQAANYVETPITPYRADALVAADGAELAQEVTMPAVFYAGQAFHIAGIMLRDGRDPLTVTLPFKLRAYPLELFDGITLTVPRYGWTDKEFRILSRTFSPEGLMLTLKETTAHIFVPGLAFLPQGYAPNSGLPRPWDIHPPSIVSVFSGEDELIVQNDGTIVNGVRVTWLPIQDASIVSNGNVEVQYFVLPDGPWRSVVVPGNATEAKFTGVEDLAMVLILARTRNSLAVSVWSAQVLHQVIGKTEPPPNMENLNISGSVLTWTMPRRPPDLAGFVFRFHYGSNLDWGSATRLHDEGVVTTSPYDLVRRPGGVVTIMGKARDTSGNESLATANIVMNLGDPPIANIVEQWDFAALGWPFAPGEQSGWTLVGEKPTADDLDSFYGTDDQSFYGQDNDPFYKASSYAQLIYVSPEVSLNAALAGSVMTVVVETQGIDLKIDYRLSGQGSFYGPDASSFYGDDDEAPFYLPPGEWQPWPGQLVVSNDVYQFRIRLGAGAVQGVLEQLTVIVDAPDIEEEIADLPIAAAGTIPPFTKPFTSIKTVQVTLQANGSGATTAEVNKSVPLAPVVRLFNAAHVAVSGATADITLKGY
ncbi:hypothetical protein H7F35_32690 [Variovorax sp. PAMC26660]|nr:hypothetical protein H7F35_32690 [Variovorax sp. PAMC26660]